MVEELHLTPLELLGHVNLVSPERMSKRHHVSNRAAPMRLASSVVFATVCSASDLAQVFQPIYPDAPGQMLPIHWDSDIAGGPSGQAGADKRGDVCSFCIFYRSFAVVFNRSLEKRRR